MKSESGIGLSADSIKSPVMKSAGVYYSPSSPSGSTWVCYCVVKYQDGDGTEVRSALTKTVVNNTEIYSNSGYYYITGLCFRII